MCICVMKTQGANVASCPAGRACKMAKMSAEKPRSRERRRGWRWRPTACMWRYAAAYLARYRHIMYVSYDLRLTKKILSEHFVPHIDGKRSARPFHRCKVHVQQSSFSLHFDSSLFALLPYCCTGGYQNVGEKQGRLSGRRKPSVFFQMSAELKLFCTHELRSAARACRRVCTLKISQSKPRARPARKS